MDNSFPWLNLLSHVSFYFVSQMLDMKKYTISFPGVVSLFVSFVPMFMCPNIPSALFSDFASTASIISHLMTAFSD